MSEDRFARIERKLDMVLVRLGVLASPAELDGQYGNPGASFTPRDWKDGDIKGKPLAECPIEALDMLAAAHDWFARKAAAENALDGKGRPKADHERKRSALCRGWAERKRAEVPETPTRPKAPTAPVNVPGKGDAYEEPDDQDEEI